MLNETQTELAVIATQKDKLKQAVEIAEKNFPVIVEKVTRAKLACSQITEIADDKQDEAANDLLVRVRKTFEIVEPLRKEITGPMDEIKAELMSYEKQITNKAGEPSEYNRIKALRDSYAAEKVKKANEEKARILADQARETEKAKIKMLVNVSISENLVKLVNQGETALAGYSKGLTLENFETQAKKLNYKPALKPEVFESWFNVAFDKTKLTTEEFKAYISELKTEFPFEASANEYAEKAGEILAAWVAKLPTYKQELQDLVNTLNADDAEKKKKEIAEREEREARERREKSEREAAEAKASAERTFNEEALNAEFEKQVGLQNVEEIAGARTKYTGAVESNGPAVLRAAIEHYLTTGGDLIKLTKELQFVLDYCAQPEHQLKVKGFKVNETVSTSARAKK